MIYAVFAAGGILGYMLVLGVRVARTEHAALLALLISKGLITRAEYEGSLEYTRKSAGRAASSRPAGEPPKGR